ncbi:MAG: enoyl-CoA hydratase/isomerase family protein [Rhodobacterales bacterium]|nr:enoyl-CoA hydratase/isomerase family protein [Rhodobacterales bacterium]
MTTDHPFLSETDADGTAWVTLNRPDVHNAFDDALIARLTAELHLLNDDHSVRAVVLGAAGRSFSAGADLNWMKRMAGYTHAENMEDARALAGLMHALNHLNKPTIAMVQGAAYGGGVGLVACCDIAIAADRATFCLSEVKLGLIPAVISPFVVAAMGQRAARRYFLTAERFDAAEALRLGLVHRVVDEGHLRATVDETLATLQANGPRAMAAAKDLIFAVADRPADDAVLEDTARRIADRRASDEGREGVGAFLEKRKPDWMVG